MRLFLDGLLARQKVVIHIYLRVWLLPQKQYFSVLVV